MGSRFLGDPKLLWNIVFVRSTINNMDDVLGSVIVTERLKTRKSLATNYWEDIISGVEVKSNDRNVKNLWKVSTSFQFCAIFHVKTTFFNSSKIHVSRSLGGGEGLHSPPPGFYGPDTTCVKASPRQFYKKIKIKIE